MNAGSRARWVALAVVCTGLAFLPMNMIMAGLSAGATARLVARFGIKPPLVGGLLLAAGLALLGHAPVGGHFAPDVLPGGVLLGIGAGTALAALLLAATGDLPPSDSGQASGIASTSFMLVLVGDGTPLFGRLASSITLERIQALVTPATTHIGFRVIR